MAARVRRSVILTYGRPGSAGLGPAAVVPRAWAAAFRGCLFRGVFPRSHCACWEDRGDADCGGKSLRLLAAAAVLTRCGLSVLIGE